MIIGLLNKTNNDKKVEESKIPVIADTSNNSFDMVFSCSNVETLEYFKQTGEALYATLVNWNANEEYLFDGGEITLDEDKEYYIYAYASRTEPDNIELNYIEIYPFPLTNTNTNKQYAGGEISTSGEYACAYVGKVSAIVYDTNTLRPYRNVEIYLGQGKNKSDEFIGTKIESANGNIKINLGADNETFSLGVGETISDSEFGLSYDNGALRTKKMKVLSGANETTIACFRGVWNENNTYNEGDEVIFLIDSRNYAMFRCLNDATSGETPMDDNVHWCPLTPTNLTPIYTSIQMEQAGEGVYQIPNDVTKNFKAGTSRVYLDGMRIFEGIDYAESSQREITLINPPQGDIEKVIIEAIFE